MTNEQLCKKIQQGDSSAFGELLDKNLNYVRGLALIMVNKFRALPLDAEDLVQEGLIALFKAAKEYDETKGCNFLTFADRVIDNAMLDYIRKVRSYAENEVLSYDHTGDEDEALDPYTLDLYDCYHYSPEQIYLRKELYERLYGALDSIPERESVYLKHRYGFVDHF